MRDIWPYMIWISCSISPSYSSLSLTYFCNRGCPLSPSSPLSIPSPFPFPFPFSFPFPSLFPFNFPFHFCSIDRCVKLTSCNNCIKLHDPLRHIQKTPGWARLVNPPPRLSQVAAFVPPRRSLQACDYHCDCDGDFDCD